MEDCLEERVGSEHRTLLAPCRDLQPVLLDTFSHTSFSPPPRKLCPPASRLRQPPGAPPSDWKQVAAPRPASRRSPSGWNTPALTWGLAPQESVPRHPSPDASPAGLLLPRDLCVWGGECWQLTGFLPSEMEPLPPHKEAAWPGSSGDSPPAARPSLTLSESGLQAPQVPHPALVLRCTGPHSYPLRFLLLFPSLSFLQSLESLPNPLSPPSTPSSRRWESGWIGVDLEAGVPCVPCSSAS